MPAFSRTSASETETRLIGEALGRLLRPGDLMLLDGPLGAGKTAFVRGIAAGMGLDTAPVSSPTFVIAHEYPPSGLSPGLVHIDAYRLSGPDDLDTVGWDRLASGGRPIVIEWAERLGPAWAAGRDAASIRIDPASESSRDIFFEVPASWFARESFAALARRSATRCPVTGVPVPADSPTYPFADERAKMADLYRWFSGSHSISRPLDEFDLEDGAEP